MPPSIDGFTRDFYKPFLAPQGGRAGPTLACLFFLVSLIALADWPQAAGPDGNWQGHDRAAPARWSVARNQNIRWRTPLPNGGQSGIALASGRIFLATFDVYKEGDSKMSGTFLAIVLMPRPGKSWGRLN